MNAGDKETSGIREMRQKAFNACCFTSEAYYSGTGVHPEANNPEEFWKIFKSWKSRIVLSDELRDDLIRKMDHWIKIRVAAIMEANRRNYYGECAAYIAAYGEVLESMGKKNAKASLMERFRAEYSRRRAFIDELRHYGMRK